MHCTVGSARSMVNCEVIEIVQVIEIGLLTTKNKKAELLQRWPRDAPYTGMGALKISESP